MYRYLLAIAVLGSAVAGTSVAAPPAAHTLEKASSRVAKQEIEFIILDPGHFHAALIQRESYPNAASRVHVYAPLGPDLIDHLGRVARFNNRRDNPTSWRLEVHTGPDFLERMVKEKAGNVVVVSGRNKDKIDYVKTTVAAGFNALVDKPWILSSADFGQLKETLDLADAKGEVALDIMTERFEVTNMLQRELVRDPDVFGQAEAGTAAHPGVYMESVHHLMKTVAGAPNIRPGWFFDAAEQGEGLDDIGTHLVDLVHWTLFEEEAPLDYQKDVELVDAQRWPTPITLDNFKRVTNIGEFPAFLAKDVEKGVLQCFKNTKLTYKARGVHTGLSVIWDYEAPPGAGDTHFAFYRGSKARVEVRQGKAEKWRTELYVIPTTPALKQDVMSALTRRLNALSKQYPGLALEERGAMIRVAIPDKYRTTHEEHFGEVTRRFFSFLANRRSLPAWEKPNMLAKYWVTTRGTELSRKKPPKVAERLAPK